MKKTLSLTFCRIVNSVFSVEISFGKLPADVNEFLLIQKFERIFIWKKKTSSSCLCYLTFNVEIILYMMIEICSKMML
jgi:hypothetical protein